MPTLAPSSAWSAPTSWFDGIVLPGLAIGAVFWIAFATVRPFRQFMLGIPRNASRGMLFVLGAAALAYAAASLLMGKTTIGAGVVLQAIEPARFWLLIKLQAGAGALLMVMGLIARGRSR